MGELTGESAGVRAMRKVVEPCCWFAMGLLLVGHVHDSIPLSMALHATFGCFLMCHFACVAALSRGDENPKAN